MGIATTVMAGKTEIRPVFGTSNLFERASASVMLIGLVIGAGLDAIAARSLEIAAIVPVPFRSVSWPTVSHNYLSVNDTAAAYEAAKSATLRRPLDPAALISVAKAGAGIKQEESSTSLAVAAQFGWRNVEVQRAIVSGALGSSAWEVAALRIVALTRLRKLDSLLPDSVASMSTGGAYASLHKAFHENEGEWLHFFKWLRRENAEEAVVFLKSMPSAVKRADCGSLISASNLVVEQGRIDVADAILDNSCEKVADRAGDTLAFRENFGTTDAGPFDWKFSRHPSVSFEKIIDKSNVYIATYNSDAVSRPFAQKIIALKPGVYDLKAIFRDDGGLKYNKYVKLTIKCVSLNEEKALMAFNIAYSHRIYIPYNNCAYQKVIWYARPLSQNPAIQLVL